MAAPLLVSLAGAGLGAAAANATGASGNSGNLSSTVNLPQTISQMNNILNSALGNALSSSNSETNAAINQQNTSLSNATNTLNSANTAANSALSNGVNTGTAENQALQAPYNSAGYQALDQYMGTLGLATPVGGSQALESNLYNSAQLGSSLQGLQAAAAANNNANPYAAPVAPQLSTYAGQINQNQINAYIAANSNQQNLNSAGQYFGNQVYTGVGSGAALVDTTQGDTGYNQTAGSLSQLDSNSAITQAVQNQLAQQQYQSAQQQYQAQLNAYNNVGNTISQTGITPSGLAQAAAYNNGSISGLK